MFSPRQTVYDMSSDTDSLENRDVVVELDAVGSTDIVVSVGVDCAGEKVIARATRVGETIVKPKIHSDSPHGAFTLVEAVDEVVVYRTQHLPMFSCIANADIAGAERQL